MPDVTDTFYPSNAFIGYGGQFLVGDGGSPEGFHALGQVKRVAPLVSLTTAVKEITHLRSPDATREKLLTLSDSAPITIEGTFDPNRGEHLISGGDGEDGFTAESNLQALRKSRVNWNFRIILPIEAGTEGSPAEPKALPLVGGVTKYEIGEMSTENEVPFMVEITPTRAYYSR